MCTEAPDKMQLLTCCVISFYCLETSAAILGSIPIVRTEEGTSMRRKGKKGNEVGGGDMDGPVLVCSIILFSVVKPSLLNMTEDWTVQGVVTKKNLHGRVGGKEKNLKTGKKDMIS